MAKLTTPIPQNKIEESFVWRDWFQRLSDKVFGSLATQDSHSVSITGGNISTTSINNSAITNSTMDSSPIGQVSPSVGKFTQIQLNTALAIAYGGTNGNSIPVAGAIAFGTGTSYNFNSVGTSGYFLKSTGSSAPVWSNSVGGYVVGNSTPYLDWSAATAPSYVAGRVFYDQNQNTLAYYNDAVNNLVHVGQEVQLKVINNTGTSFPIGSPVYITATPSGQIFPNVALAKADTQATSAVIGLTTQAIANGSSGYVITSGILQPCNTGLFTAGQILYLSPYSAGQLMNTIPPTGYAVRVGIVAYANTPNGSIYVRQSNSYVSSAQIVGQVAIANGGTNGTAAPTNGGVSYGTGTNYAFTSAGTSGQVLTSSGVGAPSWATPTSGTITAVSVVSANGLAGTSSGGATPALTLSTSVTGLLKGNGTAISAAVANTDYVPLSAPLTKTADWTVTNTDTWYINNKSGSTATVTFPAASLWPGRSLTFKNMQAQNVVSASSNVVPIDSTTAGTAILLPVIGNWATLVSDGTNWVTMQAAPNNILLLE